MSLIEIRKRSLTIETQHHEGGPAAAVPLRQAAACAVIRNPFAGRYEPDLLPSAQFSQSGADWPNISGSLR